MRVSVLRASLPDLQRATVDVGLNRGIVERRDGHLGVRRLRAELVVGVPESLAHRVDADEGTRRQEVLALQAARAHGILLRPDAVGVLGKEFAGRQLVARIAARGGLGVSEVGRAR